MLNGEGGDAPPWPDGLGPRVFAYLKWFDGLDALLAMLRNSGRPTVVYVPGLSQAGRQRREGTTLRFSPRAVDLRRAAAECDAAVLHAGQGSTATVLLAGKPVLQIPLVLEQRLTADATARLGAGEVATDRVKDPAVAMQKLDLLLADPRYATAARAFARRYSTFDPEAQVQRMVERVEELMEGGAGGRGPVDAGHSGQGAGERGTVFAG